MPNLINRSACKKTVLEIADKNRSKKFTRVSADVFEHLEYVIKKEIINIVQKHPSVGKTIMMGSKTRSKQEEEHFCSNDVT